MDSYIAFEWEDIEASACSADLINVDWAQMLHAADLLEKSQKFMIEDPLPSGVVSVRIDYRKPGSLIVVRKSFSCQLEQMAIAKHYLNIQAERHTHIMLQMAEFQADQIAQRANAQKVILPD